MFDYRPRAVSWMWLPIAPTRSCLSCQQVDVETEPLSLYISAPKSAQEDLSSFENMLDGGDAWRNIIRKRPL